METKIERVGWLVGASLGMVKRLRGGVIPRSEIPICTKNLEEWLLELWSMLPHMQDDPTKANEPLPEPPEAEPVEVIEHWPHPSSESTEPEEGDAEYEVPIPAEPAKEPTYADIGPKLGTLRPGRFYPEGGGEVDITKLPLGGKSDVAGAIMAAGKPGWISVEGDCTRGGKARIGSAKSPWDGVGCYWEGRPIKIALVGANNGAKIGRVDLTERMNDGTTPSGVEHVWLQNLMVQGRDGMSLHIPKGDLIGRLTIRTVLLTPDPRLEAQGKYSGTGQKWNARMHGGAEIYDVDGLTGRPCEEHLWYDDGSSVWARFRNVHSLGSMRTIFQRVQRSEDNPRSRSSGRLEFLGISGVAPLGHGGGAITVAGGHDGDITIDRFTLTESSEGAIPVRDSSGRECYSHGAIVLWVTGADHHGAYAWTREGRPYTFPGKVSISNVDVNTPTADREAIAITGVRDLHMERIKVNSHRAGIVLDGPDGKIGNRIALDDAMAQNDPALMRKIANGRVTFGQGINVGEIRRGRTPIQIADKA